jgi:uncharacterized protein (TIGR03000 family)
MKRIWRPALLAAAALALAVAPANVLAAGHGGGGGGFHGGGGGFHGGGGGFHGGGFGAGGFHGGYNGGYHAGYFGGYHGGYGYDHRGYGYGYSPLWPYYSSAYFSGGDDLTPDYYYSPDSNPAPDYPPAGQYTGDIPAPDPSSVAGPAGVSVHVPADAQVWFDDSPTKQTGEQRQYVTPTLPPDRDYTYAVRARWTADGKVVDQTRTITVRANGSTSVDFTQPAPAGSAAK